MVRSRHPSIADVTCNASHGAQDDRFSDISLGDRNLAGWPSKTLLAEVPENPEHEGNCQRGGNEKNQADNKVVHGDVPASLSELHGASCDGDRAKSAAYPEETLATKEGIDLL